MWTSVKPWLAGLVHAVVSGAANAAAAMFADPSHFNTTPEGLLALSKMALAGAIIGLVMYLRQSPVPPGWDGTTDRRKREDNST